MTKKVSAAQAKAHFSALMAEAAYGGQPIVIERKGKPIAALVSMDDVERLEQDKPTLMRPLGALALVGAWRELEDHDLESFMADIYAGRKNDTGRVVAL